MDLFQVQDNTRVRVRASRVRWVTTTQDILVGTDVTYEAVTTGVSYVMRNGERRRLLLNHTIKCWDRVGIWQADRECEVLN